MWIEAFGGREYIVDRVKNDGEPIRVPHLSISVLGGLQPDRLASGLLTGDDDGLQARFLWFWPNPIPPERPDDHFDDAIATAALGRLYGLQLMVDEQEHIRPIILPFAEDAAATLHEWRVEHHELDAVGMFGSSMAKMPGYVVRLALVLEFLWWSVDSGPEPTTITRKAVAAAAHLVEDYFKPMAERVYGDASLPEKERMATALARWIVQQPAMSFNARDTRRSGKLAGIRESNQMNMALEELIEAGWIRAAPTRKGGGAGQQKSDFEVNPRLREIMK